MNCRYKITDIEFKNVIQGRDHYCIASSASSDEEETTDDEKERSPTSVLEDKLDCLEDAISRQGEIMDKILDSLASLDSF